MSNEFVRAKSLEEAIRYKAENPASQIFSGGTDLMVRINQSVHDDLSLLYIGECGLDRICGEGAELCIGAAATHAQIASSPLVKKEAPILAQACSEIGSLAIRNAGTIAGNIINASPSADGATALLALDADVLLRAASGDRRVALDQFFVGLKKTDIRADEIIEELRLPLNRFNRFAWRKVGRRTSEVISVVSVAVALNVEGGVCKEGRIAVGSVAPHPFYAAKTSAFLTGKALDADTIREAAACLENEITPIDDVRATAAYRKSATRNLLRSMLETLV